MNAGASEERAETGSTPAVDAEGLSKRYGDGLFGRGARSVVALDGLSLSIRRGELFGLLGPNGSGKTTTFKLLLGLIRPTAGRARILGCAPGDLRAHQQLGFLPEESYLYRYLDADEALDFHGRLYGLSRAERRSRSDELLELVGLQAARHRPLREYSKGMSRRIGLAQALIGRPSLLLLDEPTAGMDPIGAAEVKALLRRLRDAGTTIVLTSHLLADVEDVCDRVAILHRGQLQVCGAVDQLLASRDTLAVRLARRSAASGLSQADAVRALLTAAGEEVGAITPERERLEALFVRLTGAGAGLAGAGLEGAGLEGAGSEDAGVCGSEAAGAGGGEGA